MQLNDKLAAPGIGRIRIYNATTLELLLEKSNDIQVFAKEAVTKLLAGQIDYAPSHIEVLNTGVGLSTKPIFRKILTGTSELEYAALFGPGDFSGSFTTLHLHSNSYGIFSIASGIAASKTNNESILITWTISIT